MEAGPLARKTLERTMIKAVEHFSFTVSNIQAALDFFQNTLGLNATPIMEVESKAVQTIVGMPGASLRISNVQVPGGPNLELVEYINIQGTKIGSETCNPGAAHIAFIVDDIQKAFIELSFKGVIFVNPPVWAPGNDGSGRWGACYMKGPDDITIELIERKS
jgi:catechol 2,3-dioxygenase-like lactoylglutathione lyase family enzyme